VPEIGEMLRGLSGRSLKNSEIVFGDAFVAMKAQFCGSRFTPSFKIHVIQ
jgi:hypothetical protein